MNPASIDLPFARQWLDAAGLACEENPYQGSSSYLVVEL